MYFVLDDSTSKVQVLGYCTVYSSCVIILYIYSFYVCILTESLKKCSRIVQYCYDKICKHNKDVPTISKSTVKVNLMMPNDIFPSFNPGFFSGLSHVSYCSGDHFASGAGTST